MSTVRYPLTIGNFGDAGMIRVALLAIFTQLLVLLYPIGAQAASQQHLNELVNQLARQLINNQHGVTPSNKILIVNLVDLSQLHCTSRFGLLVPEKLSTILQSNGWRIIESRRGLVLQVQRGSGQFILTDMVTDLAARVNCDSVLAGTYLVNKGTIQVNLRLITLPGNEVVSSAGGEVTIDPYIATLLQPIGYGCRQPRAFLRLKPFKRANPTVQQDHKRSQYHEELEENNQ